jgi:hypothetical protein
MSVSLSLRSVVALCVTLAFFLYGTSAYAQQPSSVIPRSDDVEPLRVGDAGTTMIGVGGYVDQFYVPDRASPINFTAEIDVGRFLTRRIAVHGGLRGAGSAGGDTAGDLPTGNGALALHVIGGARFYFTPQSIASLYAGGEYWNQITQRAAGRNAGTIVGTGGVQGALSSRASLFLEGGYGIGLTRDDGGLPRRIVGRIGVRLKF